LLKLSQSLVDFALMIVVDKDRYRHDDAKRVFAAEALILPRNIDITMAQGVSKIE
jgi:hypothetical protein